MAHTPTPWRVSEGIIIKQDYTHIGLGESSGVLIGSVTGHPSSGFFPTEEEGKANAAFIVRAVNSHTELTESLALLLSRLDIMGISGPAVHRAKEALAAAEAQP